MLKSLVKNLQAEKHISSIEIKSDSFSACTDTPWALHKSIEKITSPSALQSSLNKCIAINVHSKTYQTTKCYEREREWGPIFCTALWRDLKERNLEPGRVKRHRGGHEGKMLGKNKELKLSLEKEINKDRINRYRKLLKVMWKVTEGKGKGKSYSISGQSDLILIFRLPWQFVQYK